MKGRRFLVLVASAIAAIQIGFLVSMIAGRAAVLRYGKEVVLEVEPVDPRDLLRGDYVILTYNISSIPASLFTDQQDQALDVGDKRRNKRIVFIRLQADENGIFQPVSARFDTRPVEAASDGQIDIRGEIRGHGARQSISVNYGIERFYVPEGEGRQIEQDLRQRSFRMKIAVAEDGAAQIKSFHDGETLLYAEPIY